MRKWYVKEYEDEIMKYVLENTGDGEVMIAKLPRLTKHANLITAAPELLEAAKLALIILETDKCLPDRKSHPHVSVMLKDAIKKAEG